MSKPSVHVGLVSWNTGPLLERCLRVLPDALDGLSSRVVVVDNASSDGSADIAEHAGVEVIRNPDNRGYAVAMNQALAAAAGKADVLIALNPDTEPEPDTLAELARRVADQPGVGLVSPQLVYPDGTEQFTAYRFPSPSVTAGLAFVPRRVRERFGLGQRLWLEGESTTEDPVDVDWTIGAVHVMRTEAVDPEHPYSERWFMYVEDLDLCWRLSEGGWRRRLESDVKVTHVANAAGAAWGNSRTLRWLTATYDWYQGAHGPAAARAWAATNAAAMSWYMLSRGVRTAATRRTNRLRAVRSVVGPDLPALSVHLKAVVRAPAALSGPPGTG